jgi:RNA polymerase sigma factor (sigma-70 family)
MAAPAFLGTNPQTARLADPALRQALLKLARRRLPPGEVDDLVQNTLADALGAANAPSEDAEFRRWVQGIARHKIADLYRRRARLPALDAEADAIVADPGPGAGELTQWIERELPQTEGAKATLRWLLRESDGETLDEIARDAALPAPRVRQRVSRLRRHFQTRWLALGAAGLALLIGAGVLFHLWHGRPSAAPVIARETVTPEAARRAAASAPSLAPAPSESPPTPTPDAKSAAPVKIKSTRLLPSQHSPAKKSKAPPPKKPLDLKKQHALPNQQALPLLDKLPSKSNGERKPLPSKD